MTTYTRTDIGRRMQTDPLPSFPIWFLANVRRYQVWPGVAVDSPVRSDGIQWNLCFGDPPGVPNAIMQADHLWTGTGDPSEWGRWIDELRHRGLIVVAESCVESFYLRECLGDCNWAAQYRTADGRRVTMQRKARNGREPSYSTEPYLEFAAEGRLGTIRWLIDVPAPHFLLTPQGFESLDRAIAGVTDRSEGGKDNAVDAGPGCTRAPGSSAGHAPVPKRPSDSAFQAWRLRDLLGLRTQQDIAKKMSEELKRKVNQGEVSRWLKEVDEYSRAGYILPELSTIPNKPQSIDPVVLDMGQRVDHRTPRQRGQRRNDSHAE